MHVTIVSRLLPRLCQIYSWFCWYRGRHYFGNASYLMPKYLFLVDLYSNANLLPPAEISISKNEQGLRHDNASDRPWYNTTPQNHFSATSIIRDRINRSYDDNFGDFRPQFGPAKTRSFIPDIICRPSESSILTEIIIASLRETAQQWSVYPLFFQRDDSIFRAIGNGGKEPGYRKFSPSNIEDLVISMEGLVRDKCEISAAWNFFYYGIMQVYQYRTTRSQV